MTEIQYEMYDLTELDLHYSLKQNKILLNQRTQTHEFTKQPANFTEFAVTAVCDWLVHNNNFVHNSPIYKMDNPDCYLFCTKDKNKAAQIARILDEQPKLADQVDEDSYVKDVIYRLHQNIVEAELTQEMLMKDEARKNRLFYSYINEHKDVWNQIKERFE